MIVLMSRSIGGSRNFKILIHNDKWILVKKFYVLKKISNRDEIHQMKYWFLKKILICQWYLITMKLRQLIYCFKELFNRWYNSNIKEGFK